jgi:putative glutamine amidotransferase
MKPIIGITTFCEERTRRTCNSVSLNYVTSVKSAGGLPVLIPLTGDESDIESYLDMIDALLLTGGEDVNPALYDEKPVEKLGTISVKRDEFEIGLILKAIERKIPILGICRGHQLINVALGGSLYQDINSQLPERLDHFPVEIPVNKLYHSVILENNTKLYDIFGVKELEVNSFHHEAVKSLGRDLKASALSSDGIIEAVEYQGDSFLMGIQWHPEDLSIDYPQFLDLFKKLVESGAHQKKH